MTSQNPDERLLTIGEFSRRTRLTSKALRLEAILGCPDDIAPTDLIGVRTEPAHAEAYSTITKSQWDFPAILAAYDAVACSSEAAARPGRTLSCREVYLAEPEAIGDDDLICDIAFPLG